jgi:hypothetical protein
VPGALTEVARQTVGTQSSCVTDSNGNWVGGKPFWQMCNGVNSPEVANLLGLLEDIGWISYSNRVFWCSEAVSYWHKEASIPYPGGYAVTDDMAGWCITNTLSLANWYMAQQASGGRGRWVDATTITYDDFRPGINAPCPGAFVAINKCVISGGTVTWDTQKYHSLIVDDMKVYKDINHKVFKVELDFIEGNSGFKVKENTSFDGDDDVLPYTPQGSKWIGTNKKIYGFGVDLDSRGNPIMSKPVKVVDYGMIMAPPRVIPITKKVDDAWEKSYRHLVASLAKYWKLLRAKGGISATTTNPKLSYRSLPTGKTPWIVPANPKSDYEIVLDLQDVHPHTARRLLACFDGAIPAGFKASFASADKKFKTIPIQPTLKKNPEKIPGLPIPLSFKLTGDGAGVRFRYLKLMFPKGILRKPLKITELAFAPDEGPAKDTIVDIESSQ